MSTRDKPEDPRPYYEAHVFCCTNRRPAGHPRGCCAERGGEALRDHMKNRAKELGLKNVRINSADLQDLAARAEYLKQADELEAEVQKLEDQVLQVARAKMESGS